MLNTQEIVKHILSILDASDDDIPAMFESICLKETSVVLIEKLDEETRHKLRTEVSSQEIFEDKVRILLRYFTSEEFNNAYQTAFAQNLERLLNEIAPEIQQDKKQEIINYIDSLVTE